MFYAVAKGRQVGVFKTWAECKAQTENYSNPKFRKFPTEGEALDFIKENAAKHHQSPIKSPPNVVKNSQTDFKSQILDIKTSFLAMKAKFRDFIEEQERAFDVMNHRIDSVLLAVNGNSDDVTSSPEPEAKKPRKAILLEDTISPMKKSPNGLKIDENGFAHVYTDGACSQNGRAGAKAGYGIWWADDHEFNRGEPVTKPTNNAAEIQAIIETVKIARSRQMDKILIHTDSQFVINCVQSWMPKWKKNGWKTSNQEPVKNKIELEVLDKELSGAKAQKIAVKFQHVRGHQGIYGNEKADELARQGAEKH